MKDMYQQREGEAPFDWIDRVLRTVAYRLLGVVAFMFIAGFVYGSFVK